jgi:class 3 adenylate cyclase
MSSIGTAIVNGTALNNAQKAVLFADISGSTRLYEALGDECAFAAVDGCLDILRHLTVVHGGMVIKSIGDEIMVVFPDAVIAAQAACEMQMVTSNRPPVQGFHIDIRIGFHFGTVLEGAGDVYGDTVNMAARMTEIAQARQIITTGATVAMLPPIMRAGTRTLSNLAIKGRSDDVEVSEVLWQENAEMTMMVGNTYTSEAGEPSLLLVHQGDHFIVNLARPSITIGRDELADIVVADRRASRIHARIEQRRDKFVLIDLSSNGSYVTLRGEAEIQLRREEMVLHKDGSISLGHPCKKDPDEIIGFSVQQP